MRFEERSAGRAGEDLLDGPGASPRSTIDSVCGSGGNTSGTTGPCWKIETLATGDPERARRTGTSLSSLLGSKENLLTAVIVFWLLAWTDPPSHHGEQQHGDANRRQQPPRPAHCVSPLQTRSCGGRLNNPRRPPPGRRFTRGGSYQTGQVCSSASAVQTPGRLSTGSPASGTLASPDHSWKTMGTSTRISSEGASAATRGGRLVGDLGRVAGGHRLAVEAGPAGDQVGAAARADGAAARPGRRAPARPRARWRPGGSGPPPRPRGPSRAAAGRRGPRG